MFDKLRDLLGGVGGAASRAINNQQLRLPGLDQGGLRNPSRERMNEILDMRQMARKIGSPQRQSTPINLNPGPYEDNSFRASQQGYTPINSDIARFRAYPELQVTTGDSPQAGGRNIQGSNYNPQNSQEDLLRRLLGY